jgi:LPPG:FO 2-phospho-L-lactate transferase
LSHFEKIVVLVGGVGGAKLAHGLAQILQPGQLTVIVNTGDDLWHYGLRVCPDMDTVMYTLAGLIDPAKGWGLADESHNMLSMMQRYGETPWFGIGDRDIATHLLRTQALHDGATLTEATAMLAGRLGVTQKMVPMTDSPVATTMDTVELGELAFQDYFVRHRWQPTVRGIRLNGIEQATLTPAVQTALETADAILVGPSNPWLSIAPILSVPGMADLIRSRNVPRVAVTPIIQGAAVKGPAAKLMAELGYTPSAEAVAAYYGTLLNGFVYDERDAELQITDQRTTMMDTMMVTDADRAALARRVLEWVESWD